MLMKALMTSEGYYAYYKPETERETTLYLRKYLLFTLHSEKPVSEMKLEKAAFSAALIQ